jgi:hypothetical protein
MAQEPDTRRPDEGTARDVDPEAILRAFLLSNSGAKTVARSLRSGAEVAISFTDRPGDWRLYPNAAGQAVFEPTKALDPDFELTIPPAAIWAICSRTESDVGELGVAFFEQIVTREQHLRIQVKVRSGVIKLTLRGWLGVLAEGGPKVAMWLAKRGLRGRGAIATALERLKG